MSNENLKNKRILELSKLLDDKSINIIELLIFDICLYEDFESNEDFINYLKLISEHKWEYLLKRLVEYALLIYIPSDNYTFYKFVYSGLLQNKILYFKKYY